MLLFCASLEIKAMRRKTHSSDSADRISHITDVSLPCLISMHLVCLPRFDPDPNHNLHHDPDHNHDHGPDHEHDNEHE